jgi:hypothetical protein
MALRPPLLAPVRPTGRLRHGPPRTIAARHFHERLRTTNPGRDVP